MSSLPHTPPPENCELPPPALLGFPPQELPGWEPRWSRFITVPVAESTQYRERTFHVLDTLPVLRERGIEPAGTIIAFHGNPTWSYLWRHLATAASERARPWRVIAPDHLDMGFSERVTQVATPHPKTPGIRRFQQRIADCDAIIGTLLEETSHTTATPVVTVGHDWGGIMSLAWAARHGRVDAVITCNTAVHQDPQEPLPLALRAALAGPVLPASTVWTQAFVRTTLRLSHRALSSAERQAYLAPYRHAATRYGIGGFVADIPATVDHPSWPSIDHAAEAISRLECPALLLWGARDPVFQETYLRDLRARLPQADVQRYNVANHIVTEDVPVHDVIMRWLGVQFSWTGDADRGHEVHAGDGVKGARTVNAGESVDSIVRYLESAPPQGTSAPQRMAPPESTATVEVRAAQARGISRQEFTRLVAALAHGLRAQGLQTGDRVSILIPPGNSLLVAIYAVLAAGGVAVVADAGLGVQGMTRAVRSADPQWIIGARPGLTLARLANWPGTRISLTHYDPLTQRSLGVSTSLEQLAKAHASHTHLPDIDLTEAEAAVLFTSGSTGPAKGVRYTHDRLVALAQTLAAHFSIRPDMGLVAGFPPFALLGPALGVTSVTPDMEVTKPATLTAAALAEAISAGGAAMVFASPAAFRNVVRTAGELSATQRDAMSSIRLVLSAGAPVPLELMDAVAEVFPNAAIHSPYGMTEGLLLTDIDHAGVAAAATSEEPGVCVGTPISGVRIGIAPLDDMGVPSREVLFGAEAANTLGEVIVSAAHLKTSYDNLWDTDYASRPFPEGSTQATQSEAASSLEAAPLTETSPSVAQSTSAAQPRGTACPWHRTNDIGHLDSQGRLWLEGRVQHVISTAAGPVAPTGIEMLVDRLEQVERSAAVGVGPAGTQVVVVVVELAHGVKTENSAPLASVELSDAVRGSIAAHPAFSTVDIAAVLVAPRIPTDIRHNSKIDRSGMSHWASQILHGESPRRSA